MQGRHFDVLQEHHIRVKNLVQFSLECLGRMYQADDLRFCHAIRQDAVGNNLHSFRYTAITLLGLDAARQLGLPVTFPVDEICADLALHAAAEEDLGNKALALWAALKLQSREADVALDALLAHAGFVTRRHEGLIRSTELAWAVYALVLAWVDIQRQGGGLLRRDVKDNVWERLSEGLQHLRSQRDGMTGLFQCAGLANRKGRLRDHLKTTSGFFDSQVYGAMALAQAGKSLGRPELLQEAYATVQAIVKHQGKFGEWPWHYDVRDGTLIDPYPIFSVHQDGMGPMVLLEVGEILGMDFQEAVERSLNWVFGANELNMPMIDYDAGMIWRAQRRKGMQQYILQASRVAHYYRLPCIARVLRAAPGRALEYECRPYHLGWILYAFCRPSQLILSAAALIV